MSQKVSSIEHKVEQAVAKVSIAFNEFDWQNKEAYCAWLVQQYNLVRHTTRLLALAAARSPVGNRDLHYSFLDHLKEESHHDLPIIKDLKAMGKKPEDYPELAETRIIRNTQYYWLEYGSPYSLYGYALLLEGLTVGIGPWMIDQIKHGGPDRTTYFMQLHVNVDQNHYAEGMIELGKVPEIYLPEISANLEECAILYPQMLKRVSNLVSVNPKKIAA